MRFSFAGAIHTNQVSKQSINPFLSVDLMWADVEEDDMGAIIGLKKGRSSLWLAQKWS